MLVCFLLDLQFANLSLFFFRILFLHMYVDEFKGSHLSSNCFRDCLPTQGHFPLRVPSVFLLAILSLIAPESEVGQKR